MAYQVLYPRQVVFVVSKNSRPNIMTACWSMPASFEPPLVAIAIDKSRYTHKLIKKAREFVIAIPDASMQRHVLLCGSHSGSDTDKFKLAGLTAVPAKTVKVPLIKECQVNLECRLVKAVSTGDHTLFIGKVLAVHGKLTKPSLIDRGGRNFVAL